MVYNDFNNLGARLALLFRLKLNIKIKQWKER